MKKLLILLISTSFILTSCDNVINQNDIAYHKESKTYYIKNNQGTVVNKVDGLVRELYDTGETRLEQYYKNGKKDGTIKMWYKDGSIRKEGSWKNGKPDGLFIDYNEDGSIHQENKFSNGKRIRK